MAKAARLSDPASHMGKPLGPGAGSPDVNIGSQKAWRALPAGMGKGIETALNSISNLVNEPFLNPVVAPMTFIAAFGNLMQDASKAASNGSPSAPISTGNAFTKLMATNAQETATYTAAAAVPGGQPGAIAAYTLAMKKAASNFASAAVKAIAGMTDIHICVQPSGPVAHGPGVVTKGSKSVFINGLPACRQGDKLFEAAGGADPIKKGCGSVNIGDDGGAPAEAMPHFITAYLDETLAKASQLAYAAPIEPTSPVMSKPFKQRSHRKHRIELMVVLDERGEPQHGITLQITLPDGQAVSRTTDSGGRILIDNIEMPGACSARCSVKNARLSTSFDFVAIGPVRSGPPPDMYAGNADARATRRGGIIAEIDPHRVQSGETLDSIATQAGMTWQDLSQFNWNTSSPDEINRHLHSDVGCRRTTGDGKNYVFDSEDKPGIIYVPRQWSQSGLATDQLHVLRVRDFGFSPQKRLLRLFDGFARAIPGAHYAVSVDEREISRGVADENGDIPLPVSSGGICTVRWSNPKAARCEGELCHDELNDEPAVWVPDWEFDFTREIFTDVAVLPGEMPTHQEAAQKQLSNMGYCGGQTLAQNVSTFQRDTLQTITGVLEDAMSMLHLHHDEKCQPPPGGVSTVQR